MVPIRDILDRLNIPYEEVTYTSDLDVCLSMSPYVGELIALLRKLVGAPSMDIFVDQERRETYCRLAFANHAYYQTCGGYRPDARCPMSDEQADAVASYLLATGVEIDNAAAE